MATATAVKERPILMSGPLVKAVLEGRKSQTRRLTPKPCQDDENPEEWHIWRRGGCDTNHRRVEVWDREKNELVRAREFYMPVADWLLEKSPYRVGDRLYVRETWRRPHCSAEKPIEPGQTIQYRATNPWTDGFGEGWRPSIHMPRWASRLTLEITDVRVQRLQDITDVEAIDEGVMALDREFLERAFAEFYEAVRKWERTDRSTAPPIGPSPRQRFAALWDSLSPAGSRWADNPFCWAISFRRV